MGKGFKAALGRRVNKIISIRRLKYLIIKCRTGLGLKLDHLTIKYRRASVIEVTRDRHVDDLRIYNYDSLVAKNGWIFILKNV